MSAGQRGSLGIFFECKHELVRCAICHEPDDPSVNEQLDEMISEIFEEISSE